jgi:FkbM family methyltransferase
MRLTGVSAALQAYFKLRPIGIGMALRMCIGYAVAMTVKLILPSRFRTVGAYVPGRSPLLVRLDGMTVVARPGTGDLGLLALTQELRVATWFDLRPDDVFVDVGAHIGPYTLRAAKKVKMVVSIEPDPSVFSLLAQNVKLNALENVLLENVALSDHEGRGQLYLSEGWETGGSTLSPGIPTREHAVTVELMRLDNLASRLDLEHIDWLKIDVEGHEIEVLMGALGSLQRTKRIVIEVRHGNEQRCRRLLESRDFVIAAWDHQRTVDYWFAKRERDGGANDS